MKKHFKVGYATPCERKVAFTRIPLKTTEVRGQPRGSATTVVLPPKKGRTVKDLLPMVEVYHKSTHHLKVSEVLGDGNHEKIKLYDDTE